MRSAGAHNNPEVRIDRAAVPRLGLIALATDLTSENDASGAMRDTGAALHTTRVAFDNPTTPDSLIRMQPLLTDAARLLVPGVPLAAIWYSCTAASALIGDAAVTAAISAGRPGVPVVTPPAAAVAGFKHLGIGRIAVLTPYLAGTTTPLIAYFQASGLDAISTLSLGIEDDRDMARVTRQCILDAAVAADHPEAEALFISCTALPAMAAVPQIEAALSKPVVTSNQASLWQLGEIAGCRFAGPGRLFTAARRTEPV